MVYNFSETSALCLRKFNSNLKQIEQTNGLPNKVTKSLKELQQGRYALQIFTPKEHNKRLKQHYL